MLAAILRAQLLSLRPTRRGGRGGRIFGWVTTLLFLSLFAFFGWGAMIFFSQPDLASYFVPVLSGGMLFAMAYWQLAPVITASFGSSIDLRKLLAYPIPHGTLFTVEVLLRITNCSEMLLIIGGVVIGLIRNPLFGWRAAPLILLGAIAYCAMNILLSAGTRNLIERIFLRTRLREVMVFILAMSGVMPRILVSSGIHGSSVLKRVPANSLWPWAAPAHLMLNHALLPALGATALWLAASWAFSRWQFERGIRYDETQPRKTLQNAHKGDSFADRLFAFPSRFLTDPIAALAEKELRTFARIPRFRLVFLMSCFFGLCLYLPSATRGKEPGTFALQAGLPLMTLYGLLMLGQISFWNAFGFDRAAVQGYFSWPLNLRHVFLAKNIAVVCVLIPQILFISIAVRIVHLNPSPAKIAETLIVMLIACLYWLGLGNISSVRMPRAMNPEKMNQMSNKLQALTILLAPVLLLPLVLAYWSRWYFESEIVFAAIVLLAAVLGGILYYVCLDSAVDIANRRREEIITELSSSEGPLSVT